MKLEFDYLGDDLIYRYQAPSVSPNTWVRPTGWLTLPTITSADTKIAGLVAVYENNENAITIQAGAGVSQNYNIDWGNGTSQTGTTTNTYTKRYDYASVSSVILVDDFGYNYKQVIITITNNSGTVTGWNISQTAIQAGPCNWLDISYSWAAYFQLGSLRCPILQRLQVFKATCTGNMNNYFDSLTSLRYLRWDNITYTSMSQAVSFMSNIGNVDSLNFTFNPATPIAADYFFAYGRFKKLGNLDFSTLVSLTNFMYTASIQEIGTLNIAACTNAQQMFYLCTNLVKVGKITSTVLVTITNMFLSCINVREIVFTSCANVTTTTTAFANCISLQKLRMPGIAATFSISGCNMQRPELVALFGDLATTTAKTITITNNPGVADLTAADLLIATAKGWTVTQ